MGIENTSIIESKEFFVILTVPFYENAPPISYSSSHTVTNDMIGSVKVILEFFDLVISTQRYSFRPPHFQLLTSDRLPVA